MTRVEELKKLIAELRESGAEPEDIAENVTWRQRKIFADCLMKMKQKLSD